MGEKLKVVDFLDEQLFKRKRKTAKVEVDKIRIEKEAPMATIKFQRQTTRIKVLEGLGCDLKEISPVFSNTIKRKKDADPEKVVR